MVGAPIPDRPSSLQRCVDSLRSLIHRIETMRGKALSEDLDGGNDAFEEIFHALNPTFASFPSAQACEAAAHGVAGLESRKVFHRFPHKLRRYERGRFERHYGDRDLA